MSDTKLVQCRKEREELREELKQAQGLLSTPAQKNAKILHNERKVHAHQVQKLTHEAKRLLQSNVDLREQVDPLRQALKTQTSLSDSFASQLQEIREHLSKIGHPLAPGEPIIEKLDNMQTSISSSQQLAAEGVAYFEKYPELTKTANCEKAVTYLRQMALKETTVKDGAE